MINRYSERQARRFREFFHVELKDYWQGILGFDVTGFDDGVIKSGNQCMKDAVRQTYGTDAVILIEELLGVRQSATSKQFVYDIAKSHNS